MDERERRSKSKLLSLILRHRPADFGVVLDEAGWTPVDRLLAAVAGRGHTLSRESLEEIVRTSDKRRFALSDDGARIRAQQGHSVDVDLGHAEEDPPPRLFHGTPATALPAIRREGLRKMRRHHVHLHADEALAETVGRRRGRPVVLVVSAAAMRAAGHVFYVTPNQVWLTDRVPPEFIEFPEA